MNNTNNTQQGSVQFGEKEHKNDLTLLLINKQLTGRASQTSSSEVLTRESNQDTVRSEALALFKKRSAWNNQASDRNNGRDPIGQRPVGIIKHQSGRTDVIRLVSMLTNRRPDPALPVHENVGVCVTTTLLRTVMSHERMVEDYEFNEACLGLLYSNEELELASRKH
ncbi:hypothetical protein T265_00631 [Opisthorchis viverrini]|uniref:Uncharacterized protein n=1 Tax=Opisthorchis viverrini TaxID=6198 RepID=A0A075A5E2_OPIVI|nr:hypothetical protein T265_00631 [Opisthorchis viverrini]KER33517.1 hypothetical protein T265_00631 [Opisthorchis viverrini]